MAVTKPAVPNYRHIKTGRRFHVKRIANISWPRLGFDQFGSSEPVLATREWLRKHSPDVGDYYLIDENENVSLVEAHLFKGQYERFYR
jgi:hypothetical protein